MIVSLQSTDYYYALAGVTD